MTRKHRESGGVNEAAQDMAHKNMSYTADSNVEREAAERKHGGSAKKHRSHHAHGGHAHHEHMEHEHHAHGGHAHKKHKRPARKAGGGLPIEHASHAHLPQTGEHEEHYKHGGGTKHRAHAGKHHEMHAHGGHVKHHAGRKPRKSGGRLAGNEWSMAQTSTPAKGRNVSGLLSKEY
jgi:hypothetical protein